MSSSALQIAETTMKRSYKKVIPRPLKCIRCGVCCILVPCGVSKVSDETGLCSYLTIYKEGHASCRYIKENGNLFGGGCFLRRNDEMYKLHREEAENRIGIKLVGIKESAKK